MLDLDPQDVLWQPNPGPQTEFLRRREYEALYGGAAGGGKSDALVLEALRQIAHPRYRGIIFRRSLPECQELIDKSHIFYPAAAKGKCRWQEQKKQWVFDSGAVIRFRYLKRPGDETRYQGHEYQFIGFDELTHFTEHQYSYLKTRCRTSAPGLRCYVRASSNPGGPGHTWVKHYFVDAADPGAPVVDPDTGLTRIFIPARLYDNPILVQNDPNYMKRLMALPEQQRKALLEGDWDAFEGQVFTEWRKDVHVVEPYTLPSHWPRWIAMDWGFSKPYAVYWLTIDYDGKIIVYRELYGCVPGKVNVGTQETASAVAKKVKDTAKAAGEKEVRGVADPAIWSRAGHDGPTIAESFQREGVYLTPADNDRIQGKMQLHDRLRGWHYGTEDWNPGVVVFSTCRHLIRTLPSLPPSEKNPDDIDTDAEDHAYDAFRYGLMKRQWKPEEPASAKPRDKYAEGHRRKRLKGGSGSWMSA